MSNYFKQTKQETIIYTIVWLIIFLAPLAEFLFNYDPEHPIWIKRGLLDIWTHLLFFFIVFLIHNHILSPILLKQKNVTKYIICCVTVIALFLTVECTHAPNRDHHDAKHREAVEMQPPPPDGRPPIHRHDITMFILVIMMLGANLGVKCFFQNEEEKKHLAKLKAQSLKQELDYLRYQINPHFIMNTLNNIHALVDIDPEQAKDSIVDMSRMMRYLLYESDKQYVTLNMAIAFLKKYLNLLKLRYTDQVKVLLDVPETCSENVVLAPLVFVPFVENAFKHGVAYDRPSSIEIDIKKCDGRLLFHCSNTKNGVKHEYGGVGLNNVTKRLELIYGNDYTLTITDGDSTYDVLLDLPERHPEDFNNHHDHTQGITPLGSKSRTL